MLMNSYRVKLLVAFVSGACLAGAVQAAADHQGGAGGLQDRLQEAIAANMGSRPRPPVSCMDRNGHKLSKVCVNALVKAGEVSQAEVDRRKRAAR